MIAALGFALMHPRGHERIRLKKYVVTDYVKKRVPVQRERLELEREPPAS